jgi:hypothetical protein
MSTFHVLFAQLIVDLAYGVAIRVHLRCKELIVCKPMGGEWRRERWGGGERGGVGREGGRERERWGGGRERERERERESEREVGWGREGGRESEMGERGRGESGKWCIHKCAQMVHKNMQENNDGVKRGGLLSSTFFVF